MTETPPMRLLIVDDDPQITSALVRGLRLYGYEAEPENRADHALERLLNEAFSGAIIDVMLGTSSGIELVRAVRARGVTLPIVMLSALSQIDERAAGLEAGADDYIVKPFDFDELVARLQVQMHRTDAVRPGTARLIPARQALQGPDGEISLTDREFELLTFLMDHFGEVLTRGMIFDALWADEGAENDNVASVYIGYLRKKLSQLNVDLEISTLRNEGYRLTGRPPLLEE